MAIPKPYLRPQSIGFSIGEIFAHGRRERYAEHQTFKGEWLFDFKIPPFQRPVVWTEEQSIAFIESAWLGFDIGSYVINRVDWNKGMIHEFDGYLIDGLQRITALKNYSEDKFEVFDLLYSELTDAERRRFENVTFTQNRIGIEDDKTLRVLYNRLNYGGTAHTEDQRA